ncbi:hypothetical protein C7B77_02740 [Chamaesiphon polymorphus CCALA 037]|uniref:Uncharacterized protein n=1 Tax=Chamaesiphon polymorphus CCALA 037 TaxID=2107692 RepID=A0A2T1GM48_9CYAN|nr:hypothetical protein C7B77_02740 [Chamaesiphon polymorphus CCALA 037]
MFVILFNIFSKLYSKKRLSRNCSIDTRQRVWTIESHSFDRSRFRSNPRSKTDSIEKAAFCEH